MLKRLLGITMAFTITAATLMGCGNKQEAGEVKTPATEEAPAEEKEASVEKTGEFDSADSNQDGKVVIGYSASSLSDNYMVETSEKLQKLCEGYGYEYTVMGAEGVTAKQIEQIENMVTMGCDWIYAMILDPDAMEEVFRKAEEQNTHIVYIGTAYEDPSVFTAALAAAQYDFGYQAAEAAAQWIDENYPDAEDGTVEVAVFKNSILEDFQKRADGFAQIETLNSKAKIVETYDLVGQDAAAAKCQEYTDQLFMKHPDVKVILSHSSDYGTAIDEVIMRTPALDPETIGLFSDDWLIPAANGIKDSVEGKSTFRALVASGDLNQLVMDLIRGEVLPDEEKYVYIPMYTFDAANIDEAFEMFEN